MSLRKYRMEGAARRRRHRLRPSVTHAIPGRSFQLAMHVAGARATKLVVAVATSDLASAREDGRHAFAYAPGGNEATLSSATSPWLTLGDRRSLSRRIHCFHPPDCVPLAATPIRGDARKDDQRSAPRRFRPLWRPRATDATQCPLLADDLVQTHGSFPALLA